MDNRRNYYRILHVQPEAPLEIIKASYRSLMSKLKAHPDLGGDHGAAVLINQAYAVLSDPARRRRYDDLLRARGITPMAAQPARSRGRIDSYDHVHTATRPTGLCAFCGHDQGREGAHAQHCAACGTPLASRLADGRPNTELFGRRSAPRIARAGDLVFYPQWPHAGHRGRLRDLSLSGLSFTCTQPARGGQLLKIESSVVAGLARVASVRMEQGRCTVHAALVTAEFAIVRGGFVHERA